MDSLHDNRLRVLAEASRAFASIVNDYRLLLDQIARATTDLVGDGCLVTLLQPDGETLYNAASAHRDPTIEADYRAYLAGIGIAKASSATVAAQVIRTGEPKLVHEVAPSALVAQSDPPLKPLTERMNVHSFVVVPIRARGAILGAMSLFRSRAGADYTADDLVMLLDLADRAGLAIENARLYAELEHRVRLRTAELEAVNHELEAFSYSVAHDLRAPLRAIDNFSEMLVEDCGAQLDDRGREHITRVRRAARHMSRLIDDLLGLSRITRTNIHRESVSVSDAAAKIVERLREGSPQRQIQVDIAPDLATRADPRLLEVALANLLGNAWKFTGLRDRALVEVGMLADTRPSTFFIRDNGAGFDPTLASKLFVPFQRLHDTRTFEGSGIGLATVQRIIHRHGGRIWAESAVERGATFYFTFEAGPT